MANYRLTQSGAEVQQSLNNVVDLMDCVQPEKKTRWVTPETTNLYDEVTVTQQVTAVDNPPIAEGMKFLNWMYFSNNLSSAYATNLPSGAYGGSGIAYFPVEPGKTYSFKSNHKVVLNDEYFNNITYGYLGAMIFYSGAGLAQCGVVRYNDSTVNGYFAKIDGVSDAERLIPYGPAGGRVVFSNITADSIAFKIDEDANISYVCIQLTAKEWRPYSINTTFNTRGHLTAEELDYLNSGIQINEGSNVLPYESGHVVPYLEEYWDSTIPDMNNYFSKKAVSSTNLLNLDNIDIKNHKYVPNSAITIGTTVFNTNPYNRALCFVVPISEAGIYTMKWNEVPTFHDVNTWCISYVFFLDASQRVLAVNASYYLNTPDQVNADIGSATNTKSQGDIRITVASEQVKNLAIIINSKPTDNYGLWTTFPDENGLTDEEVRTLLYQLTLFKGKSGSWEPYDKPIEYKAVLYPENVLGLSDQTKDFEDRISAIESGITTAIDYPMTLVMKATDNNFYIRAKEWQVNKTTDYLYNLVKDGGENHYFNFNYHYTLPHSTLDEMIPTGATMFKGAGDDICPPNINGTYIGANHGYAIVREITFGTAHSLTEVDIGSEWNDTTNNNHYILVKVPSTTKAWFVYYNESQQSTGVITVGGFAIGHTLEHVSGATHTTSLVTTTGTDTLTTTQLWPAVNHYSIKCYVDGVEVPMNKDSITKGYRVEVKTVYDIIFVPAMLTYLITNVGNNTNTSLCDEAITDYYIRLYINYQFNRNGSCSTYSSFYVNKPLTVGYIGLVQSIAIASASANGPIGYVPDTSYDTPTIMDGTATWSFGSSTWNNPEKVPYRFYQMKNNTAKTGMCLVYDPTIGWGVNSKRLLHANGAGMYYTSLKQYPAFISGGTLSAGQYFDGNAARVPLYNFDNDLFACGWFWSGENIILMIDSTQVVNKELTLPDYMNNMRIEVLDKTDTVTCDQTFIFDTKFRYIASGTKDYLVVKLSY